MAPTEKLRKEKHKKTFSEPELEIPDDQETVQEQRLMKDP